MSLPDDLTRTSSPEHRTSADAFDSGRFVAGTILASRYRIIGLLGLGGMGEVYKAEDLLLGQAVALKFLPQTLTHHVAALARLRQEVRLARQVSHPNVCRVYDLVDAEGTSFLSMEFIDGEDLGGLLKRVGRLPADRGLEVARQIAAGLAAAHDQGVLHRDLKPANVMIDRRGRARLTDFGLAAAPEAAAVDQELAGTMAYMAPELLAGGPATVRSDLFAMGLVLYELFTGTRVFDAAGLLEVQRLHAGDAVKTPSSWVKDLDPLVERAIMRCLDYDPARRPTSAAQVVAWLPGGDPLQAALLAGETPSPDVVAAAGSREAMRPAVGLAWVAVIGVGLIALVVLTPRVALSIQSGTLAPDALRVRGREILQTLGYATPPGGSWVQARQNVEYQRHVRSTAEPGQAWARLTSGRPHSQRAFYRESPRPLVPVQPLFVTRSNPPLGPGMALVEMDGLGRLKRVEVVPEVWESEVVAGPGSDWDTAFHLADLDRAAFTSVAPLRTPPHASDTRAAWSGHHPNRPDAKIRIEAAAYKGRVVFFDALEPWEMPSTPDATPGSSRVLSAATDGVIALVVLMAGLIAWRNYRSGRGDRRGAVKLSLVVGVSACVGTLALEPMLIAAAGLGLLWRAVGDALQVGAVACVLYFALEPYVRRRWPRSIITWSRLLAGEWRDPMVGRDVLIGTAFAVLFWAMSVLAGAAAIWFGHAPLFAVSTVSARDAIETIALFPVDATFTLGVFLIFVIARSLFRRTWLAAVSVWAAIVLFFGGGSSSEIAIGAVFSAVAIGIVVRWGLLVLVLASPHIIPALTLDPGAWYFGGSFVYLAVVAAAAWYGFRTATAGQPIAPRGWLEG